MDIGQLIEQLKNGDDSAGPILVSILAPRLLGYAAMIASDLPLVDQELVVELAIEKSIVRIDLYDPSKGTFVGWVRGFVRFAIADWRRHHPGGAPVGYPPDTAPAAIPDKSVDADRGDGDDEIPDPTKTAIVALVLSLSEADQLLLRLRYAEDLPHAHIAEQLGVSEQACRKRLQRALARLRALAVADPDFDQYFEGDES